MTLYEYDLLMTGIMLKKLDEKANNHQQAWLNRQVNAEKMNGKKSEYVYKKYSDFFNYDKEIEYLFYSKGDDYNEIDKMIFEANRRR